MSYYFVPLLFSFCITGFEFLEAAIHGLISLDFTRNKKSSNSREQLLFKLLLSMVQTSGYYRTRRMHLHRPTEYTFTLPDSQQFSNL
jgi:hypothetical protein